jgi:LacI family transcriptional regulator
MGVKIPDELSFIGFDNLQISQIIMPKLAIVLQPIEKIAENAAQIMLQRLSGQRREATVVTLSPQLVPGDSVKKLNL